MSYGSDQPNPDLNQTYQAKPLNLTWKGATNIIQTSSKPQPNTPNQTVQLDMKGSDHTSYLSILAHRRIIEVYKKYTKKLSELATK